MRFVYANRRRRHPVHTRLTFILLPWYDLGDIRPKGAGVHDFVAIERSSQTCPSTICHVVIDTRTNAVFELAKVLYPDLHSFVLGPALQLIGIVLQSKVEITIVLVAAGNGRARGWIRLSFWKLQHSFSPCFILNSCVLEHSYLFPAFRRETWWRSVPATGKSLPPRSC